MSKSSRLSLSRVLNIHEVLRTDRSSRHSKERSNDASLEKLETEIEDINKELRQLRDKQIETNEKIADLKIETL